MSTLTCTGPPVPPARKPMPLWRQLALMAATAIWRLLAGPPRPLGRCPHLTGFPPKHPESMRRHLRRRDERWLEDLDRELQAEGIGADITRTWRLS
jgi:hypothetical protein